MKRMQVHVSVDNLARATAFYRALLGVEPAVVGEDRATFSVNAPPLDLTVAVDGKEPGLESLAFGAETEEDLFAVQRRLGAANLSILSEGERGEDAPELVESNRAVDPMGLAWEGYRTREVIGAGGQRFHVAEREAAVEADEAAGAKPFAPEVMGERKFNVLFLCRQNASRSVLAEAIMNRVGFGRFRAFSAGSHPADEVHPRTVHLLQKMNFLTAGLKPKSWEQFTGPDAPPLDFVFTLCDVAASEVSPIWPGQPMSAHWSFADPAQATGNEATVSLAFADTYRMLDQRISIFVNLPFASLDRMSLQRRLDRIGRARMQPRLEQGRVPIEA